MNTTDKKLSFVGFRILSLSILLLGPASNAVAQSYDFHSIADSLEAPFAGDINNRGQVVGYSGNPFSGFSGFIWQDGQIDIFDAPDANFTFGNGINDSGVIVGHAVTGESLFGPVTNRGFARTGDVFVSVNFDPFNSWAFDINSSGSIVGNYCEDGAVPGCLNDPLEVLHAYMLDEGGYTTIDPPNAFGALAFGNNDRGDAVGGFADEQGGHGFLREKNGEYTRIDGPNAVFTEARGINTRGDVVGFYVAPPDFVEHGFVRDQDGDIVTVDFPGAFATLVTGINDRGDICGVFVTQSFELKSFVGFRRGGR